MYIHISTTGITDTAIVSDNLRHYVKNIMFRDKPLPNPSSTRFYPTDQTIRNHVASKLKLIKQGNIKQTATIRCDNNISSFCEIGLVWCMTMTTCITESRFYVTDFYTYSPLLLLSSQY